MVQNELQPAASILQASLLTAGGRGAEATIGLRGEISQIDVHLAAANGLNSAAQPQDRICFGWWGKSPFEEVVFVRTGEGSAELHCHGGMAAAQRILQNIRGSGGAVADSTEWLFVEHSPVEAECLLALTRTTTERAAEHVLRQCALFPAAVSSLWERTLKDDLPASKSLLGDMLTWAEFGTHLTQPWKVVVCGRPNVGKSSLINALVGFTRTVVFDQPGTTRDVVSVETALNGWPVELSDTAGLRTTDAELESQGIERARARIQRADLVVVVLDASAGLTEEDRQLLQDLPSSLIVWNKSDLVTNFREGEWAPSGYAEPQGALGVSALARTGFEELIQKIANRLVPDEPPQSAAFPVTSEQRDRLNTLGELLDTNQFEEFQRDVTNWLAYPAMQWPGFRSTDNG